MPKPKKELKTIQFSLRVTPSFRNTLAALAEREGRSMANMLGRVLGEYVAQHPLELDEGKGWPAATKKVVKKR